VCFLYPMNQRVWPVFLVRPPSAAPAAESEPSRFFIFVAGRRQIGGVDQRQSGLIGWPMGEQLAHQSGVELAQHAGRELCAELVQLAHVGQPTPMR